MIVFRALTRQNALTRKTSEQLDSRLPIDSVADVANLIRADH